MGTHSENLKRMLAPEAYEDFLKKCGDRLSMREEVADKFRDLNPPGMEHLMPDGWTVNPWMINWIRDRGGFDLKTNYQLEGQYLLEAMYRVLEHAMPICREVLSKEPPPEELIQARYLCYPSMPPIYVVRPDLGFGANRLLYGESTTVMWAPCNYWTGELDFFAGWHNEGGVPQQGWIIGMLEEIPKAWPEEELDKFIYTEREDLVVSGVRPVAKDLERDMLALKARMDRRDFRSGIRMRELPKESPYNLREWLRPARDIGLDMREEYFPRWVHATLYFSLAPGNVGISTWHNFWATSQWWNDPWVCMNATKILGWPMQLYTYVPSPEALDGLVTFSKEVWIRQLGEMFLSGPKEMLCDAITKLIAPEDSIPLMYEIRRALLEGKMYKDFALPYDDGIPPPRSLLTALPCPFYKEANILDIVADPNNLSKEYRELLESEEGIDFKTGRIPPYDEVPRLKWLFDPTIEWLKPKDFPPIEWSQGQVWPIDVTREKMEIMVEEGYDGSGKEILHYSALADKKIGQLGKTIMLGTMSYKLPTCGCSPQCG